MLSALRFQLYAFVVAVKIPKKKRKNSLRSKLAAALLGMGVLALIAFLAMCNWQIYQNRAKINAEIEKKREQLQVLQEQRETLKAGLRAASGESFQEEKMREQGYKKPGEEVIAILRDRPIDATNQTGEISPNGFWANFWQKIKNIK